MSFYFKLYSEDEVLVKISDISKLENECHELKKQLKEANGIITHVVFDSKDSSNIAYDYLAKHGLIRVEK